MLGHFVLKTPVWGDSLTSIFEDPSPAKIPECGHTRIACRYDAEFGIIDMNKLGDGSLLFIL